MDKSPDEMLAEILRRDKRYTREAYAFVSEALSFTVERTGRRGHVSGEELCHGLKDLALKQFGPLARTVLDAWGIRRTEDVGEVVFNMVDVGLLRKTAEDTRADFADVFDFGAALEGVYRIRLEEESAHGPNQD